MQLVPIQASFHGFSGKLGLGDFPPGKLEDLPTNTTQYLSLILSVYFPTSYEFNFLSVGKSYLSDGRINSRLYTLVFGIGW